MSDHADEDLVQRYLTGALSDDDRAALEEHYFECARCRREVQRHWAMLTELRRAEPSIASATRPRAARWIWIALVPLAAAALIVVAVRQIGDRTPSPAAVRPLADTGAAAGRVAALQQLARIEPPEYVKLPTRTGADLREQTFDRGMEAYARADFQEAAATLERAQPPRGRDARVDFFLGVSLAMIGETTRAAAALTSASERGSPYAGDARMILAKMDLAKGDTGAAIERLNAVVTEGGPRAADAHALVDQIRAVR